MSGGWDRPEEDHQEGVELNLTSLVDVMLVLLIIFMVSTSAMVDKDREDDAARGQVELQLPSGRSPTDQPSKREVVVQIDADGNLFQDGAATEWKSLSASLLGRLPAEPELQVRIDADQRLPVQRAVEVLEDLQALGIRNVGLGTQKK
jgi:biopolymer transport protein ExbD